MKKIIFIIFHLLSLQYIVAANKAPLYILDGQYVQSEKNNIVENISPDDIATIQTLDSATAVGLYGERASGGAVIVRTKKFEAKNYKPDLPRRKSDYVDKRKNNPERDRDIMALIIIAILSFPLSKWIVKWYTKAKANSQEQGNGELYLPSYLKNAESVQFKATSTVRYYIWIVWMALMIILWTYLIFSFIPELKSPDERGWYILVLVCFTFLDIMFIVGLISYAMNYTWHLTIDEKGIRGMYQEGYKGVFFPKFKKINIQWKYVSSAELVHRMPAGRGLPIAGLAVFYKSKPGHPKEIININLFSTRKIIESASYFYVLHQERYSLEPKELMDAYRHKDDEKFRWVIYFATCIILTVIYLVIVQF